MNKIDSIKKQKNLTYKDIANATGLTSAYICMLAKGQKKNPSKEVMEKIANVLGKTVPEIFFPKTSDKKLKDISNF